MSAMISIARPLIGDAEREAVDRVLRSGIIAQGPEVAAFEAEFAACCGVAHAVATTNGTTALHLALLAADVGPADEVITTPFTFFATASSIAWRARRRSSPTSPRGASSSTRRRCRRR